MSAVRERARPSSDAIEACARRRGVAPVGAPASQASARPPGRFRRALGWTLIGLFAYLFVEALVLPPARQPSVFAAVGAIRLYQSVLSPSVGRVVTCKFRPTCSHYGAGAIEKYGTVVGTARTFGRLWRCSPWGPPPGEDQP